MTYLWKCDGRMIVREVLAVAIIVLFIGISIIPSIASDVIKESSGYVIFTLTISMPLKVSVISASIIMLNPKPTVSGLSVTFVISGIV